MSIPEIDLGSIAKKYPVHEEFYSFLRLNSGKGFKLWHELNVPEARDQMLRMHEDNKLDNTFEGTVTEMVVSSPDVVEGIPVSVYSPKCVGPTPTILVFLHGGGLVVGSRLEYELSVKKICQHAGVIVVFPEYRLLPNSADPLAPFDDCRTVVRWVLVNKTAVGGVAESKVGVGGDSAGGQLTSSMLNDIRDVDFAIMVYPVASMDCGVGSCKEFQSTPFLFNTDSMQWFFRMANQDIPDAESNPVVNPAARKNWKLNPPTLMLLAQMDPLRDWGIQYAEKLRAAGVPVQVEVIEGVPHGFFALPTIFKTTSGQAFSSIDKFIKNLK